MPVARRQESEKPRPIAFKLLKFSNEAKLLNAASNAGTVIYKSQESLFPLTSAKLNNEKVAFFGINNILKSKIKLSWSEAGYL